LLAAPSPPHCTQ